MNSKLREAIHALCDRMDCTSNEQTRLAIKREIMRLISIGIVVVTTKAGR